MDERTMRHHGVASLRIPLQRPQAGTSLRLSLPRGLPARMLCRRVASGAPDASVTGLGR